MFLRRRGSIIGVEETPQKPFLKRVATADLFTKPKEDYHRTQTFCGGLLSLFTLILIGSLVLWEVAAYISGRDAYRTEIGVDTSTSTEFDVNLDITFPRAPCHQLSLDVLDIAGTFKLNVLRSIQKTPVNSQGELAFVGNRKPDEWRHRPLHEAKNDPDEPGYCGRCFYEPKNESSEEDNKLCCNTCDKVMKMHDMRGLPRPHVSEVEQCVYELSRTNPGCNCKGTLALKKVNGMLVFAPKRVGNVFRISDLMRFDASHNINSFSIGDERVTRFSRRGVHYPLNGHLFDTGRRFAEIKYFLKVVPTTYFNAGETSFFNTTYEYSVYWNHRYIPIGFGQLPSVVFVFDFYPMQVNNYFKRPSFYHFLVQLCGIAGGLFVILELLDSLVMRFGSRFLED